MSAILKDDILSRKSREISGKDKVNKIMSTIVEPLVKSDLTKQEHKEVKSTIETTKTAEDTVKQNIFSSEILIEGECASDLEEIRNRLKKN